MEQRIHVIDTGQFVPYARYEGMLNGLGATFGRTTNGLYRLHNEFLGLSRQHGFTEVLTWNNDSLAYQVAERPDANSLRSSGETLVSFMQDRSFLKEPGSFERNVEVVGVGQVRMTLDAASKRRLERTMSVLKPV